MDTDIQQRVLKVVAEILERNENEIQLNVSLRDQLQLDSLKQMTLFIALEDEFQRAIPPEEAEGLATINDVVEFIQRKMQEPALV